MKKNSEIYFDQEKYISSRQAAEFSGYAHDYIGQLCRSGKLECQRVGRDWLVAEKKLVEYKNKLALGVEEKAMKLDDLGVDKYFADKK